MTSGLKAILVTVLCVSLPASGAENGGGRSTLAVGSGASGVVSVGPSSQRVGTLLWDNGDYDSTWGAIASQCDDPAEPQDDCDKLTCDNFATGADDFLIDVGSVVEGVNCTFQTFNPMGGRPNDIFGWIITFYGQTVDGGNDPGDPIPDVNNIKDCFVTTVDGEVFDRGGGVIDYAIEFEGGDVHVADGEVTWISVVPVSETSPQLGWGLTDERILSGPALRFTPLDPGFHDLECDFWGRCPPGFAFKLFGPPPICIVHGNPDWEREDPSTHFSWYDWAFSGYIDPKQESSNGVDLDMGIGPVDDDPNHSFPYSLPITSVIFNVEPFGDPDGGPVTPDNVSVEETGAAPPPNVVGVTKNGNALTVELDRIITLQEWTTVMFDVWDASGVRIVDNGNEGEGVDECARLDVGFLPGDVNNSGRGGQPLDLGRWMAAWRAGLPIPPPSGVGQGGAEDYLDISRNGLIQPQDLARLIALMKGQPPFTRNWRDERMNNPQP